MEGFDSWTPRAVHQSGHADVLLRPMGCGKMLPPQLNLVIEIEFADATTALWSENAAGATLSTDFEIQNVRVLASQVVLDSALVESFNRALLSGRSLVFSHPTVQSTVPPTRIFPFAGSRKPRDGSSSLQPGERHYLGAFFYSKGPRRIFQPPAR